MDTIASGVTIGPGVAARSMLALGLEAMSAYDIGLLESDVAALPDCGGIDPHALSLMRSLLRGAGAP